jgi:hypothetical protein
MISFQNVYIPFFLSQGDGSPAYFSGISKRENCHLDYPFLM